MIEIVNIESLDADGKKIPANNPNYITPSLWTHAQLRYNDFSSNSAVQGTFISGYPNTVEFDLSDVIYYSYYKLYLSTDGTTYTEIVTYGGTDGKKLENTKFSMYWNGENTTILENNKELSFTISQNIPDFYDFNITFNKDLFPLSAGVVDFTKCKIDFMATFFTQNEGYLSDARLFARPFNDGTATQKKRTLRIVISSEGGAAIPTSETPQPMETGCLIEIEILP